MALPRTTARATRKKSERSAADSAAVVVRSLRPSDMPAVRRIDKAHSGMEKASFWKIVSREFLEGSGSERFRIALAAETAAGLQGFALGEVRAFEFGSEACGWVFAVGVDPGHERQGIGAALLGEACRRFREAGVRQVRTMVQRAEVPMLSFFRSYGFVGGNFAQLQLDLDRAPAPDPQPEGGT